MHSIEVARPHSKRKRGVCSESANVASIEMSGRGWLMSLVVGAAVVGACGRTAQRDADDSREPSGAAGEAWSEGGELASAGHDNTGDADAVGGAPVGAAAEGGAAGSSAGLGGVRTDGGSPNNGQGGSGADVGVGGAANEPCQNDGQLTQLPDGADGCDCPEGTWGATCEKTTLQVVVGCEHSCALKSDHTAVCWGENVDGGSLAPQGKFRQLAAGCGFTCGIRSDSSVACWGRRDVGQTSPPSGKFTSLAAGNNHACAVTTSGDVKCWGSPDYAKTTAPSGTFSRVFAGRDASCALASNKTGVCWGHDAYPVAPTPSGRRFVELIPDQLCGLTDTDTVECWGDYPPAVPAGKSSGVALTFAGLCGIDQYGTVRCPDDGYLGPMTLTPPTGQSFVEVAGGGWNHFCARTDKGQVSCRSRSNLSGEASVPAGHYTDLSVDYANLVALRQNGLLMNWGWNGDKSHDAPPKSFSQVAVGSENACGIGPEGSIDCWGAVVSGTPSTTGFVQVDTDERHACALKADGEASCWGFAGDGSTTILPGQHKQISTGYQLTCALRVDGTLHCFGGDGTTPLEAPSGVFQSISTSDYFGCAVTEVGTPICWDNPYVADVPSGKYSAIAAGPAHVCALDEAKNAVCWGKDPDPRQYRALALPGPLSRVAVGYGFVCGLSPSGALTCAGTRYRPAQD